MRAKLYNRVAVTALAGIPRGQPSSKLTSKRAGTPRRWLRALQCRSDAPSMSVPGQRWSDRERLGSSMLTDIGGAAHTNTSHSSQLNPMSPTRCSATLDIFEVNFDEGCSFENVSLLVLPMLRSDFQLSSCDASAPPLFPPSARLHPVSHFGPKTLGALRGHGGPSPTAVSSALPEFAQPARRRSGPPKRPAKRARTIVF